MVRHSRRCCALLRVAPVLVEDVVLHTEGVLSEGVEHVVAHRRHGVLPRLQVHHLPRYLKKSGDKNVDGADDVDGGVPHTNIGKNSSDRKSAKSRPVPLHWGW